MPSAAAPVHGPPGVPGNAGVLRPTVIRASAGRSSARVAFQQAKAATEEDRAIAHRLRCRPLLDRADAI